MTKVQDVMTRDVAVVQATTPFKRIAELLVERKVSAVPVVDDDGVPIGLVSEADLITRTEFPAGRRHARSRGAGVREHLLDRRLSCGRET